MPTHAETKAAAEKAIAEDRQIVEKAHQQYVALTKGKPTPSQKECDLIKMGVALPEKEDDGAGPEPRYTTTRSLEAGRPAAGAQYATRRAAPASSSS